MFFRSQNGANLNPVESHRLYLSYESRVTPIYLTKKLKLEQIEYSNS